MAEKYAKWLGGAMGWAFGGPVGALVGFSLGYLWDNATLEKTSAREARNAHREAESHPGDFAISLLVLSAAVMKADHRVLKSELQYVKHFLVQQFGANKAHEYLNVLRDLIEKDYSLTPVCEQINHHLSHADRLQLVHFLIGIAQADGEMHQKEWDLIVKISTYLHIREQDRQSLKAMYDVDEDRYYRILEINSGASENEIKQAYRAMVKKYHPDRLGDVGEDVKAAAKSKFLKVQEAYEKLTNSKK